MFDYCAGEHVASYMVLDKYRFFSAANVTSTLDGGYSCTYDDKPLYMHVHYLPNLTLLNHSTSPSTQVIRTNITCPYCLLLLSCFRYEVVNYYHYIRFLALEVTVIPRQ